MHVEVALNNRPLTYLEDDIQLPVLTPNSLLQINPTYIPEEAHHHIPENGLRKRVKFLQRCKQKIWNRWSREYVRSLRERHGQMRGKNTVHPKIGEIVIVREENQPRNKWKIVVVTRLIKGAARGAVVRTTKGTLERAVQHLFPLELSCDLEKNELLIQMPKYFSLDLKEQPQKRRELRLRRLPEQMSWTKTMMSLN